MKYLKYYNIENIRHREDMAIAVITNIAFERHGQVSNGYTAYVSLDTRRGQHRVRLVNRLLGIDWEYLVLLEDFPGIMLSGRDYAAGRALEAVDVLGCLDPTRLAGQVRSFKPALAVC